jgi:hypothetical protein
MKSLQRWSLVLLASALLAPLAACGEDDPEPTPMNTNNGTNNGDNNGANNGDNNGDNNGVNNGVNNGTNNGVNNGANNGVNNGVNNGANNGDNNGEVTLQEQCEMACAGLAECAPLIDACGAELVSGLGVQCSATCADEANANSILLIAGLGCDGATALIIESFDLAESCPGVEACAPLETDYVAGADDMWGACISDNGEWNRFQETISTAGRLAAFEQIADLLWRGDAPSGEDFLSARELYAVDQGLDSRVTRREDEHLPPVSDGMGGTLSCRDEGVPAMDPARCVGPAQMAPLLNDAFREGALGNDPALNAAQIEATLLWFLYLSTHKEAVTCTQVTNDCDSSYAYYTGDQPREGGLGLAAYLRAVAPDTHDRVWDGLLAVRCWRDLDNGEEATDLALRDRAVGQLDRALLHGVARVVLARVLQMELNQGAAKEADWRFIQILGAALDREAGVRDPDAAAVLAAQWAKEDPAQVDPGAIIAALLNTFQCN